jgi:hypothetical protein
VAWSFLPLVAALYLPPPTGTFTSHAGIAVYLRRAGFALAFAFWRAVNRLVRLVCRHGACLGLAMHFYTASRFFLSSSPGSCWGKWC